MATIWRALDELPTGIGVAADWQAYVGDAWSAWQNAFLDARSEAARSVYCSRECGCAHRVVAQDDGRIVAVCECDPWNCDDIELTPDDIVSYEFNRARLGRAVCRAFDLVRCERDLNLPWTQQIAMFSSSLPVILTIQPERAEFNRVVAQLVAMLKERFILLAPTSRHMDAHAHALLNGARAGFFDLESHLTLMPSGVLHARKSGGELFSALVAPVTEEPTIETARRLYALVLACHTEQVFREAPIKSVFDLYCKMGFSAEETAIKLKCSKATIINRLKFLREKTGVSADKLRDYKPFFEQIETSLADPRARRIRREDAIHGDDPDSDRGWE